RGGVELENGQVASHGNELGLPGGVKQLGADGDPARVGTGKLVNAHDTRLGEVPDEMNSPGRRVNHGVSQKQLRVIQQALRGMAANRVPAASIDERREQFDAARASLPLAKGFTATPGRLGGVGVL